MKKLCSSLFLCIKHLSANTPTCFWLIYRMEFDFWTSLNKNNSAYFVNNYSCHAQLTIPLQLCFSVPDGMRIENVFELRNVETVTTNLAQAQNIP